MSEVDVTVVIPTKNEGKNLPNCLDPIKNWAKKILIVDSYSEDNTVEVAHNYDVEFILFKYEGGWPKKRQYILNNFTFCTQWILFLDADEILTSESKIEIQQSIENKAFDGYYLIFKLYFLGKLLKKSDPGLRKLSLFKIGKGHFENRLTCQDITMGDMEIHEHIIVEGKVGIINSPIIHNNVNNLYRFIDKHNEYSNYECKVHLYGNDKELNAKFFGSKEQRRRYLKMKFIRNPIFPIIMFIYLYIFRLGFLEGLQGFYYSAFQSIYILFVNSKIFEEEQLKRNNNA